MATMTMIQEEAVGEEEAEEREGEECGPVFGGGIGRIFGYLRSGSGVAVVERGFFVFEWWGRAVLLLLLLKERRRRRRRKKKKI